VATTDYSLLDAGYLRKRGFHWYAYDTTVGRFLDLSAASPMASPGLHASIMATASTRAMAHLRPGDPHGSLFRYDIAQA